MNSVVFYIYTFWCFIDTLYKNMFNIEHVCHNYIGIRYPTISQTYIINSSDKQMYITLNMFLLITINNQSGV